MTDALFDLPTAGRSAGPRRVKVTGNRYNGRIPDGAIYVGREAPHMKRSKYANPHTVADPKSPKSCRECGVLHDRAGAVAAFVRYLISRPDLVADARRELAGADLACWCDLDGLPCHGEILRRVAAGEDPASM